MDQGPSELLRIDTETDLTAVREVRRFRDRQRLRRPPKRSDAVWLSLTAVVGLAGWVVTGPHPVWFAALAVVALWAGADLWERRRDQRTLDAIDEAGRRRTLTFHDDHLELDDGGTVHRLGWRDLTHVHRLDGAYVLRFRGDIEPLYVPAEALGSTGRSGRLEALLAAHDRVVSGD
jgi:hypothetical protein